MTRPTVCFGVISPLVAKKSYQKTQLDDEFFSLREMEEICQKQEEQEVGEAVLDDDVMDELYGDGGDLEGSFFN